LSGPESMILTHQLRACCDAILVGIGTVLADNPSLTVRLVDGADPQPIVLDTRLRTPLNANLVRRSDVSTWIVNGNHDMVLKNKALRKQGATLIHCSTAADGMIELSALMKVLAKREVDSIMVEGGARVITSFVKLKLVDLFIITVAPKLVGGLPVIDAESFKAISFVGLEEVYYQNLGDDLIIWARPHWNTL
jgi:riboflavin-specific deaminase-like protein